MTEPNMIGIGEGGIIGAVIGWFLNLFYMREKFVSVKECEECKQLTAKSFEVVDKKFEDGSGRMERIEAMQVEVFGMVKEIHGILKFKG